jgi:hypothetical protein
MAEGMASGADEALVFDSLAERGRSGEWPLVLDQVMRWQGVGMAVAMLVGGAVYDPVFVGHFLSFIGAAPHPLRLTQGVTLRFPIYLNFITALATLWTALGLREPAARERRVAPADGSPAGAEVTARRLVMRAGAWILKTPVALFVIVAGVLLDSVARLLLTFSSSYFRSIDIPEAVFGLIGAGMGGLGLIVSPLARRMVAANSLARNYLMLAAIGGSHWRRLPLGPLGRPLHRPAGRRDDGARVHGLLLHQRHRRFEPPGDGALLQGCRVQPWLRLHQSPFRAGAARGAARRQPAGCAGAGPHLSSDLARVCRAPLRGLLSPAFQGAG